MDTNQKLREALQAAIVLFGHKCHDDCTKLTWLERAEQALALPTAALPRIRIPTDAMEQEFQNHYRRGFEAGKCAALPTAALGWERHQALMDPENQPNQFGLTFSMRGPKMAFCIGNQCFQLDYEPDDESDFAFMQGMLCKAFSTFTPDVKTAAPVGEREAFEKWLIKFDRGDDCTDLGDDGYYCDHGTQRAWMAWQARAAMSAGDAVDAQRTPLTDDQMWSLWNSQGIDEMNQSEAIAFARNVERAHGIDAAMRKGQL